MVREIITHVKARKAHLIQEWCAACTRRPILILDKTSPRIALQMEYNAQQNASKRSSDENVRLNARMEKSEASRGSTESHVLQLLKSRTEILRACRVLVSEPRVLRSQPSHEEPLK